MPDDQSIEEEDLSEGSDGVFGYMAIVIGFFIALLVARHYGGLHGVGLMGIIVFVTMLLGVNALSKDNELTMEEVRLAIVVSFITVFFGLLAVGDEHIQYAIMDDFSTIIIAICAFFFGVRVLDVWSRDKTPKTKSETEG